MQEAQTYLEIVRSRGERGLELRRVYRNLQNKELFLRAYAKLYANAGALTPGIDPNEYSRWDVAQEDRLHHRSIG